MRDLIVCGLLVLLAGLQLQGPNQQTDWYPQLEKKGANPFVDPAGFKAYVDRSEKSFQARLEEQKKAAAK